MGWTQLGVGAIALAMLVGCPGGGPGAGPEDSAESGDEDGSSDSDCVDCGDASVPEADEANEPWPDPTSSFDGGASEGDDSDSDGDSSGCAHASEINDGYCDDYNANAECEWDGSDCDDPGTSVTNDDSCINSHDEECDGPPYCDPGTDCTDCGMCDGAIEPDPDPGTGSEGELDIYGGHAWFTNNGNLFITTVLVLNRSTQAFQICEHAEPTVEQGPGCQEAVSAYGTFDATSLTHDWTSAPSPCGASHANVFDAWYASPIEYVEGPYGLDLQSHIANTQFTHNSLDASRMSDKPSPDPGNFAVQSTWGEILDVCGIPRPTN